LTATLPEALMPSKITVRDAEGPVTFIGSALVDLSWDTSENLRWTNMVLYTYEGDGPYEYILHVVGRSLVYHKLGGCRKGVRTKVGAIAQDEARWQELVQCRFCNPKDLEDLDNEDEVLEEKNRPSIYYCQTPEEVIEALRNKKDGGNLSGLALSLLDTAAMRDPAFAKARNIARTI
jgi:hypothetical protein